MKTEIILFDSESYDPHKHKKYYLPAPAQMRSAVKSERKLTVWTPRLRLLLIAVLLMMIGIFGILWIITS